MGSPSTSSEISPATGLAGKDQVLLYFSAHWCPPCRRFTPKLIEFYNKLKSSGKNIELVFCSLDNSETDYKEYISNMPWLCMLFEAKESKTMAGKYGARGIPHLVVVDGSDGKIITMDGTSEVSDDFEGINFPWKPKSLSEIWPEQIILSKGDEDGSEYKMLDSSEFKDKYLMLYFSASWCPPCQAFTPKLSKAYEKLKKKRQDFELVFVSSDRNEGQFDDYYSKKMSFCALPFKHRNVKNALSKMFEIQGIPALVVLDKEDKNGERQLINSNVRSFIEKEDFESFPYPKLNYGDVNTATEELNSTKAVIIFAENCDDGDQNEIKEALKEVAGKFEGKENDVKINFLWVFAHDGLSERIRELTKLPAADKAEDPAMIMLDIPDDGAYYKTDETDITVENVMKFVASPGDRLQLS